MKLRRKLRGGRLLLAALGVMALLGLANRAFSTLLARFTTPTDGGEWIWIERNRADRSPAAFYAARDFTLERAPASARLLVTADPEYILYLNGKRLGAGRYQAGSPLDVYEVGDLLETGGNRLLAELRSDWGAGGFLAVIQDADTGRVLVRTDESWRIVRQHHLGVTRGWLPLQMSGGLESAPAYSWGLPPTGRWGRPRVGPVRLRFAQQVRREAIPAAAATPGELRTAMLFDWGREVTGYLSLQVPGSPKDTEVRTGLVFTGAAPPDPRQATSEPILIVPGRRAWMAAAPRRFRYALVLGLGQRPLTARVFPVEGAEGVLVEEGDRRVEGVFGVEPPRLRTPVEDEVWRKLQRVPGVRGGKDL